jgi:ribosomal protein S18 acetylase RimI-like enzyme
MSIAVLPEWQGKGIGRSLLNAFLDAANQAGCSWVKLTTDRENNASVNAFYINAGFTVRRSFSTPEGRLMNEYIIALEDAH